jgi:hypothetical protein
MTGAGDSAVTLLSLDFRQVGVGQRLTALRQFGPSVVEVSPEVVEAADVPEYVDSLTKAAPIASDRVILVTYCAAFGLVGEVMRALTARGTEVVHVVAVDAVTATVHDVREAFGQVFEQFGAADPTVDLSTTASDVARNFDRIRAATTSGLSRLIFDALGAGNDSAAKAIAQDLLARYETFLTYVLACYGATTTPWEAPSTAICSTSHDMSGVDVRFARVVRCHDDSGACPCLAKVINDIRGA